MRILELTFGFIIFIFYKISFGHSCSIGAVKIREVVCS